MERTNKNSISLNKYISSTGLCSRRVADKMIVEGRVTLNGQATKLGNRVVEGDIVRIDGKRLQSKPSPLYIAFNKPVGIVCTTNLKEPQNIIQYINHSKRLFPIGRLDKPSQGLIFLTNDGDIVNKILRAGNNHEKEYIVWVDKMITPSFLQKMRQGIPILGTMTKKCSVTKVNNFTFKIILTQGLNRQIRRMCAYLGYEVTKLKRIRIMTIKLENLAIGQWRSLEKKEMEQIHQLIATSSKTEEASFDKQKRNFLSKKKRKGQETKGNKVKIPKNKKR